MAILEVARTPFEVLYLNNQNSKICDKITAVAFAGIAVIGCFDIVRYFVLGEMVSIITTVVMELLFVLPAYIAWRGRLPLLMLPTGIACIVMFVFMNNWATTLFNGTLMIQSAAAFAGATFGTRWAVREKCKPHKVPIIPAVVAVCVIAVVLTNWMVQVHIAKRSQGRAENQLWAVPEKYDSEECDQPGSVTKLTYRTKAYGTDMRDVEKSAYVYLPYGYDETKQYNILYLMHGTGDNEAYWFETHAYNKTMVDHLIASGDIDPLIIVTPTFYVEDDCMNELDHLTYSFAQELRNDLMPVVESTYSTYAESCDSEGFTRSRDHRAFAGLSRGAVTAYHSAMCASLDYFSWFGAFSGSRTTADYFRDTIQSEGFEDYSINYLYVSSGNFDFAHPNQLEEYQALLDMEPRLVPGENTALEVYPMRYHSIGSWHLALYNFLLKIF